MMNLPLLLWMTLSTPKILTVYTDKPISPIYVDIFKRNGYTIYQKPLPENIPQKALDFLKVAQQYGQKNPGTTLMIKQSKMTYLRFGNPNYGIKGLAFVGKPYIVVSTGSSSDQQIAQIILHEFGHTIGLEHCSIKNCLMNDAKGNLKNVKNSKHFCSICKKTAVKYLPN